MHNNLHQITKIFLSINISVVMLFGISLSTTCAEEEEESPRFVYIVTDQSLFGYSKISGDEDGTFSTSNQWAASGSYRLTDLDRLMFIYNGSFEQSNLFISQEEGSRESNQLMSHNFTAMYHRIVTEDFFIRPSVYHNIVYIKETNDEDLGEGLYDYQDSGFGIENMHLLEQSEDRVRELTYSFNLFDRTYPRYQSLLSQFDPNSSLEEDEKDFLGYKVDASYSSDINKSLRGTLTGQFIYKDFEDKLQVDENGIRLVGDKREDFFFEFTGRLDWTVVDGWGITLSSLIRQNESNLDFYDTRNTASLTDDRFFEGYFDYLTYQIHPSTTFSIPLSNAQSASLQLGYYYESSYYHGRNALDVSGSLLFDDQSDDQHNYYLNYNHPVNKNLSFLLKADYRKQESNQKFESFYRYNYELWSVLSGIALEF